MICNQHKLFRTRYTKTRLFCFKVINRLEQNPCLMFLKVIYKMSKQALVQCLMLVLASKDASTLLNRLIIIQQVSMNFKRKLLTRFKLIIFELIRVDNKHKINKVIIITYYDFKFMISSSSSHYSQINVGSRYK